MINTNKTINKQTGVALVLSLILLTVLTLLGLTSMRNATLEEKMAYNMRDLGLAFEAAESGLREAENWLNQQNPDNITATAQTFVHQPGELPDLSNQTHSWWTDSGDTGSYDDLPGSTALDEVNQAPLFVIEDLGLVRDDLETGIPRGTNYYRITARGTGATDTAQSITQNTFAKRIN